MPLADVFPRIIYWCDFGETVVNILLTCRVVHATVSRYDLEMSKARRLLVRNVYTITVLHWWIPTFISVFELLISQIQRPLTDFYVADEFMESVAKNNRHDIVDYFFAYHKTSMAECRRKMAGLCHDQCGVLGNRILHWAAAYGRLELVDRLIRNGVAINADAVLYACRGYLPLLKLLERRGLDFQDYELFRWGLHEAVMDDSTPALDFLLQRRANSDIGRALTTAVRKGNTPLMKLLLRNDFVLAYIQSLAAASMWELLLVHANETEQKPIIDFCRKLVDAKNSGLEITGPFIALLDIID